MNNIKIIQLITELYPAGAEKIVLNLSRELKAKRYDISVISLQPLPQKQTDIVDDLKFSNIKVDSLNVTKFTPWRILKLIKILKLEINTHTTKVASSNQHLPVEKTLAKAEPTTSNQQLNDSTNKQLGKPALVLHSHLIHANLTSRLVALFINRRKIKIINTIHIAEKRKSKWWHFFLDKLTFKLCNVQTVVSEAAQQYHAEKIGVKPDQIPVIYNGIVPPKQLSSIEVKTLIKEWKLEDCTRIIGSVGRLDWQKGYDVFLNLIPELSKKIPEKNKWGIVILGEGPQRDELQKIIDDNRYNNIKIILPGYRKDAADCISAFDLFIMPSRYEGFGLTLIEAMAHGTPCLCSNADSLPNLIKDYPNGTNANFESIETINTITNYITLKKQKPYFLFTTENMANAYLKIYSV